MASQSLPFAERPIYAIVAIPILYFITRAIYRAYFDSLSSYPGPKTWAASDIPRSYHMLKGDIPYRYHELHMKYGPVVRVGPNFLSYSTPDAWNDIYARVRPELSKDPKALLKPPSGVYGVAMTESESDHSRMRRNLAHGVSEKALRDQEPILTKYFDSLIQKLRENSAKGPIDISCYFNFVTVDIIGDLTFGQSFGCLETTELHDWVRNMFDFVKMYILIGVAMVYPPLDTIIKWAGKTVFSKVEDLHRKFAQKRTMERLQMKDTRPDFLTYAQQHYNTPNGMSFDELEDTCVQIILGGSETTATTLTGLVYYLLKNPPVLQRLVEEIRTTFPTRESINMVSTRGLKYEPAVIDEVMRIFPPVPNQIQRITNPQGNIIAGRFVPGNTSVSVSHYSCYHSPENFHDPEKFDPERWLGDERYKDDRKKTLQPFSLGPRNCLGMNLAYAETRMILTLLLWNFDIEFGAENKHWMDRIKVFMIYQRPPLVVKLSPVVRE